MHFTTSWLHFRQFVQVRLGQLSKLSSFHELELHLEQVLHLDPRRLDMVWPFLTVYSRQRGVDVTVADVSLPLLGNPRKRGVPLSEAFLQPSRKQAYLVRSIGHEGPETTFVREAILEFSMQNKVEVRIREWRRGERVALSTGQRKVIAEAASDRRGLVFATALKTFKRSPLIDCGVELLVTA